MRRGRGLADTALEVGHRNHLGGQAFGPVGAVFLVGGTFRGEMVAQPQGFFQREPFGAAGAGALWQIRVAFQHPPQMGRRNRYQIAADLPGGKLAQVFLALGRQSAFQQIVAAAFGKSRGFCESHGVDRLADTGGGTRRIKVEIGR